MKQLLASVAILAMTAPAFAQDATTTETVAVVEPAATVTTITAETPGMTASWLEGKSIYSTLLPSTTEWVEVTDAERPEDWKEIAKIEDVVVTADGQVAGYLADVGGFLGLGAKRVLLAPDALHMTVFGDEDPVLATNFTEEELKALPEFAEDTVLD